MVRSEMRQDLGTQGQAALTLYRVLSLVLIEADGAMCCLALHSKQ